MSISIVGIPYSQTNLSVYVDPAWTVFGEISIVAEENPALACGSGFGRSLLLVEGTLAIDIGLVALVDPHPIGGGVANLLLQMRV